MTWDWAIIMAYVYIVIDRICEAYVKAHKKTEDE